MEPLNVVLAMRPTALAERLFDDAARRRLDAAAEVWPEVLEELTTPAARRALEHCDVLVTGWGAGFLSDAVLATAPRLRAVVHTGGNATHLLGPAALERRMTLTDARAANGRPVAELSLALILLAGKQTLPAARLYAERRALIDREQAFPHAGNHGRRVGIVGASCIGRQTIELLKPFDLAISVFDPYLTDDDAQHLGVHKVELDELMATCTVVSVHAPDVPATQRMIDARRLALLPDGATLVNTARGALVDTDALVAELATGRIDAILDVTEPEPLPADHPLWTLPNVLLTPHIAGSMGNELGRLGENAVMEIERLARE
ncbi:Phosphoglycerate dehydrogenase [Promicromonospora umidemergens]|uniref:Hydroxyacid dehydrogenase n=1 Tax=Promicromonospora umidemergens TaxID=629679 RepID=A0ABP8WJ12_9MICO|nr:hydroxyacid dehydrogenase [Promicromonospora umidemergens]MCP2283851.1 Phosphoglycerate dehydrogenase [Promicromonospora umidemergens]